MRSGRFGAALVAVGGVVIAHLIGCAGPCPPGAAACREHSTGSHGVIARDDAVCLTEPLTGTHIVETRCYRRRDIDERRAADRAAVERMLINANRPQGPTQSGTAAPTPTP